MSFTEIGNTRRKTGRHWSLSEGGQVITNFCRHGVGASAAAYKAIGFGIKRGTSTGDAD